MTDKILPPLWLIILIIGLPQLSETVYTPSLPSIAQALNASDSMVEYTLTIYLFGFSIGTLFWGKLSDKTGRKPCILYGMLIFIIGCVGCYLSPSINALMISRFIQAFGGSIGSVLGQSICRDAFHGPRIGKIYASIATALAVFPVVGPVVGGVIAEHTGWRSIFLFLVLCSCILSLLTVLRLPETLPPGNRTSTSILRVGSLLLKDRKVMGFVFIISSCLGIVFSYFAEGSFSLIKILGLTPSQYGLSFLAIACASMLGGMLSKRLHDHHTSKTIMKYGLIVTTSASLMFSVLTILYISNPQLPAKFMICVTLLSQMSISFGNAMTISNVFALALEDYKWCVGTASSVFGFLYFALISLVTLGMGKLHNGTLLPMPLYFLSLSIFTLIMLKTMIRNTSK
jgi:DHA1 family bicyclomycin/chloramphenicol resistance-like MFS transporter